MDALLPSINKFYSENPEYFDELRRIIDSTSDLSSRLIDYFVTQYCRENPVFVGLENINLYNDYSHKMNAYKKKVFDAFRRGEQNRIEFSLKGNSDDTIVTTIGQLNFFKWFFSSGALEYIRDKNIRENVMRKMLESYKSNQKKKRISPKKGIVSLPSNLVMFD